jgi:hypothetical protein
MNTKEFWRNYEKFCCIKVHLYQGAFLSFKNIAHCLSNTLTVKVHLFLMWFNKTRYNSLIPSSAFALVVSCLVCISYSAKNVKPWLVKLEYHSDKPDKDCHRRNYPLKSHELEVSRLRDWALSYGVLNYLIFSVHTYLLCNRLQVLLVIRINCYDLIE